MADLGLAAGRGFAVHIEIDLLAVVAGHRDAFAALECLAAQAHVDGTRGGGQDHAIVVVGRSEEHTSELQSQSNLVCRLLLEKKKKVSGITKIGLSRRPCR